MSLLSPPATPEAGDDILDWARDVTAFLRAINPNPGPEIWPQITTTGTHYLLKRLRGNRDEASGGRRGNLEIYNASTGDALKIGVTWGTICGRQPTGFSAGGLPAFTHAVTETGYVFAKATANLARTQWTSTEIVFQASAVAANTATVAYQMIGSYKVEGGKLTGVAAAPGNVDFSFCALLVE